MISRIELLNRITEGFDLPIIEDDNNKTIQHSGRVTTRYYPTEANAMTPNGVVGRCRRRTYYSQKLIEITNENDILSLWRFKLGNIIENILRENSIRSKTHLEHSVKIKYNIPGNDKIQISGEVDLLYKIDNEIIGGEIKSSYGYDFTNTVMNKQTIPGMPKIDHLMQVLLYLYYYKYIDTSLGINRFVITYFDRGYVEKHQHVIELSDDLYPIVNGIVLKGISDYSNPILSTPGLNREKTRTKLIDYEFNMRSIFDRFIEIYNYHESGMLVPRDYNPLYTEEQITDYTISGKIGKTKYSDYKSGKIDTLCDKECQYCPYKLNCLKDSGII